jgi:hypothetical protein
LLRWGFSVETGLCEREKEILLSEPSFAFLFAIVEREKRERRKKVCMQTLLFLSFACLQETLFPGRSKEKRKVNQKT